MVISQMKGVQM